MFLLASGCGLRSCTQKDLKCESSECFVLSAQTPHRGLVCASQKGQLWGGLPDGPEAALREGAGGGGDHHFLSDTGDGGLPEAHQGAEVGEKTNKIYECDNRCPFFKVYFCILTVVVRFSIVIL